MADIELVIKIPEEIYKASQIIDVKYEDVIQIPLEVIANGIPIPDNVTNGDVMKIIFPKIGVYDEWYDEPYQKGVIRNDT